MLTLAAVPSVSVALVVIRSATYGFASGAAAAFGIASADLLFVSLAMIGLSALADTLGTLFIAVKYAGGAYLLWLGLSLLRSVRVAAPGPGIRPGAAGLGSSFIAGFLLTLGDVKAIFFYASLFPVFVDMNMLDGGDVAAVFIITLLSVAGVKLAYAWSAAKLVTIAPFSAAGRMRALRVSAGMLMMAAGGYLIVQA